ncbi:hypothetical protein EIP86_009762 [Pleurotus ostreatoroseus]|nr:hypothetical protein EIP86_009762 [Pleurotus ostreatoroseus]
MSDCKDDLIFNIEDTIVSHESVASGPMAEPSTLTGDERTAPRVSGQADTGAFTQTHDVALNSISKADSMPKSNTNPRVWERDGIYNRHEVRADQASTRPDDAIDPASKLLADYIIQGVRDIKAEGSTGWMEVGDALKNVDDDRIYKEDIDTILVFTGLFSAVLTAFVVESYQSLSPDPNTQVIRLLSQIAVQTKGCSLSPLHVDATLSEPDIAQPFQPSSSDVLVNRLWFTSLVLSLITASFGILIKQWLREYKSVDPRHSNLRSRLRVRQFRYPGMLKWRIFEISAFLPLLIQLALGLFLLGLCLFTWSININVGRTNIVFVAAWIFFLVATALAPAISSECPYKLALFSRIYPVLRSRIVRIRLLKWLYVGPLLQDKTDTFARLSKKLQCRPLEESDIAADDKKDLDMLGDVDDIFQDDELLSTMMRSVIVRGKFRPEDIESFTRVVLAHRAPHIETSFTSAFVSLVELPLLAPRVEEVVVNLVSHAFQLHVKTLEASRPLPTRIVPTWIKNSFTVLLMLNGRMKLTFADTLDSDIQTLNKYYAIRPPNMSSNPGIFSRISLKDTIRHLQHIYPTYKPSDGKLISCIHSLRYCNNDCSHGSLVAQLRAHNWKSQEDRLVILDLVEPVLMEMATGQREMQTKAAEELLSVIPLPDVIELPPARSWTYNAWKDLAKRRFAESVLRILIRAPWNYACYLLTSPQISLIDQLPWIIATADRGCIGRILGDITEQVSFELCVKTLNICHPQNIVDLADFSTSRTEAEKIAVVYLLAKIILETRILLPDNTTVEVPRWPIDALTKWLDGRVLRFPEEPQSPYWKSLRSTLDLFSPLMNVSSSSTVRVVVPESLAFISEPRLQHCRRPAYMARLNLEDKDLERAENIVHTILAMFEVRSYKEPELVELNDLGPAKGSNTDPLMYACGRKEPRRDTRATSARRRPCDPVISKWMSGLPSFTSVDLTAPASWRRLDNIHGQDVSNWDEVTKLEWPEVQAEGDTMIELEERSTYECETGGVVQAEPFGSTSHMNSAVTILPLPC